MADRDRPVRPGTIHGGSAGQSDDILSDQTPVLNAAETATPQIGMARRVLVVEDDGLICDDIECTLEESGFDVIGTMSTLAAAMDFVKANSRRIDCAVLDVELAGQSSLQLAKTLDWLNIPYLVVTAYSEKEVRELGFRAQVVEKPFRNGDLAARMSGLLA